MTGFLLASFLGTPVWFWLAFLALVIALTAFQFRFIERRVHYG